MEASNQARKRAARVVKVGERWGRLIVQSIERRPIGQQGRTAPYAQCVCDCGNDADVCAWRLTTGGTISCGCYGKERRLKGTTKHGMAPRNDNLLYNRWVTLIGRCYNPEQSNYPRYGGRGIFVDDVWRENPVAFIEWARRKALKKGMEIDRIDNNGPYSPSNCRVVTRSENQRNRRTNHQVTAFGETKCLAAWQEDPRCQVSQNTLLGRIKKGWSAHEAITRPSRKVSNR